MGSDRSFRPLANHSYLPIDAGIMQNDRVRRAAAEEGSCQLLKRIHVLLVKMEGQS